MIVDTKEKIQYGTAVLMVISAVVLAFICFFLNHYKIEDSVLWYIAQALVYAASIFGIARHQDEDGRGEERHEAVC